MDIILSNYVALYFPSDYKAAIKQIELVFSRLFDGYTTIDGNGGFVNKNGIVEIEKVKIVFSYTDTLDDTVKKVIRKFARQIGFTCSQEGVAIVFNQTMEIIKSSKEDQLLLVNNRRNHGN